MILSVGGKKPKMEHRASTRHQSSPLHHCVPMSGWNEYKDFSNYYKSGHRDRGCVWLLEVAIIMYYIKNYRFYINLHINFEDNIIIVLHTSTMISMTRACVVKNGQDKLTDYCNPSAPRIMYLHSSIWVVHHGVLMACMGLKYNML